ncbi:hypothetical protein LSTR_LSTR003961 [Laodelphax striatellus]|uniref:Uncharacterized protein n=1 Tax=Laodelphax striatellus TaxID=195883 RepID=A0A482X1K3_LAOST|nr:hypothetical protein LSTR_LSTR003961 [Laodelphax striatellus]
MPEGMERIFSDVAYMGSTPVTGLDQTSRAEFVRSHLEQLRDCPRSKPVLLVISLAGIKVCSPDGKCTQPEDVIEEPLHTETHSASPSSLALILCAQGKDGVAIRIYQGLNFYNTDPRTKNEPNINVLQLFVNVGVAEKYISECSETLESQGKMQ